MPYNPEAHHRQSIRLRDYDYSRAGAYFVTICAWQRECLFGEVVGGEMRLNDAGRVVTEIWDALPQRYQDIEIDVFVAMPNHIHGIIVINDPQGVGAIHVRRVPLLTPTTIGNLTRIDERSRLSGLYGANPDGRYQVNT